MSRSRRHTPITGNCVTRSDRPFKTAAHRSARVAVRSALAAGGDCSRDRRTGDHDSGKDGRRYHALATLDARTVRRILAK